MKGKSEYPKSKTTEGICGKERNYKGKRLLYGQRKETCRRHGYQKRRFQFNWRKQ